MKLPLIYIPTAVIAASIALSSCGGSGGGNSSGVLVDGTTTAATGITDTNFNGQTVPDQGIVGIGDPAPSTLDATTLKLFENDEFIFQLGRISGDASVIGGTEIGFATSILTSGEGAGGFFTTDDSGLDIGNDLPASATDISYSYTKTGTNSGTFTFTGDLRGDGYGDIDLDAQVASTDAPDLLSFDDAASAIFFLTFGTDGQNVSELAVSGRNLSNQGRVFELGTDGNPITPLRTIVTNGTIDYDANTANNNTYIKTQDGSAIPLGYNTTVSSNVDRIVPSTVYPLDLSNAGSLYISYDTTGDGAADTYYHFFGATSTNVGFTGVLDQGFYRLEIYTGATLAGATIAATRENVQYGWNPNIGTVDQAQILLTIPSPPTGAPSQQYGLNFISFERGSIVDQNGGAPGTVIEFEFPQADQGATVIQE